MPDEPNSLEALEATLKKCRTVAQVQRQAPMVQLLAVAKGGAFEPTDLRISGQLKPQEARRVIDALRVDNFIQQIDTLPMSATEREVDVLDANPRQLQRVPEGDDPADDTLAGLVQLGDKLHALPCQLFAKIKLSTLREHASDPNFSGMVSGKLQTAYGNELVDLGFNGVKDDNSAGWPTLNKGWPQIAREKTEKGTKVITVSPATLVAATLQTGDPAANNALLWTAAQKGSPGNDVAVTLVNPQATDQALSLTVTQRWLVVMLATDATGAVTTTAADIVAAVAADPYVITLVDAQHATDSDGSGVVTPHAMTTLEGGRLSGWIDALADVRAASDTRWRDDSVYMMNKDDADAYNLEIGRHVTGSAVIANEDSQAFLKRPVIGVKTMPSGTILFTPPKNLVMGVHTTIRRDSEWHATKRVVNIVLDTANDYGFNIYNAVVLAERG